MASFPKFYGPAGNLLINAASDEDIVDEGLVSRALSGAPKIRRLQEQRYAIFKVVMRGLSDAQLATFKTFWDSNRNTTFDFYWPLDETTYPTCFFGPKPYRIKNLGTCWEVSLDIWEA